MSIETDVACKVLFNLRRPEVRKTSNPMKPIRVEEKASVRYASNPSARASKSSTGWLNQRSTDKGISTFGSACIASVGESDGARVAPGIEGEALGPAVGGQV